MSTTIIFVLTNKLEKERARFFWHKYELIHSTHKSKIKVIMQIKAAINYLHTIIHL